MNEPTPPPVSTHPLTKAPELEGRDGQRVVLRGTYQLIDVRQRQRPPPQYRGHAGIQLEGVRIFLEPIWAPEALRPADEQALNGKEVEVVGTYFSKPPESPQGDAQLMVAVLRPIESVTALTD